VGEEIKRRKAGRFVFNDKGYGMLRIDVFDIVGTLGYINLFTDVCKNQHALIKQAQAEAEKKFKIEVAKAENKNFIAGLKH
jgi:hypothetical protein